MKNKHTDYSDIVESFSRTDGVLAILASLVVLFLYILGIILFVAFAIHPNIIVAFVSVLFVFFLVKVRRQSLTNFGVMVVCAF